MKCIQDEIGDWHDWLLVGEEARKALKDPEDSELIRQIEAKRDRLFRSAMRTTHKLRGRLMGELLALSEAETARKKSPARMSAAARELA